MNIKVIVQVAYMSAFRPSFCLNGSFARVFKIFRHRDRHTNTHTGPITLPLRKRGVIKYCHSHWSITSEGVRTGEVGAWIWSKRGVIIAHATMVYPISLNITQMYYNFTYYKIVTYVVLADAYMCDWQQFHHNSTLTQLSHASACLSRNKMLNKVEGGGTIRLLM